MSDALTAASAEAIAELQRQQRQQDRATDFTNAFNAHRAVLAGFATCADARELRVVRDGFFLGLGRELCPALYAPVKQQIVEDFRVAAAAGTAGGFAQTIAAARSADGWDALVKAVFAEAEAVGSDLNAIWGGLEAGRLEWLDAVTCAHALKVKLREALAKDGKSGEADVQAAKMVWMYTLALNVPQLQPAAAK